MYAKKVSFTLSSLKIDISSILSVLN